MNIAPKTAAAGAGGGIAVALVSITAWILSFHNIVIPPDVGAALATIFSTVGAFFAPRSQQQPTP